MVEEREPMNHMFMKNIETGEEVTVDYMNGHWDEVDAQYKDFDKWEILSSTSDEPYEIKASGFTMMDFEGNDYATELLPAEDGLLIVTVHHLENLDAKGTDDIKVALALSQETGIQIVMLTAALPEEVQAWLYQNKIQGLDYLFADATAIETMMRGNPGFMFVKNATVVDKTRKIRELKIEE